MIEIRNELVADDSRDIILTPHPAYVLLVSVVLLPDEIETYLLRYTFHLLGMLLFDGLQCTCYGVRATPRLQPHRTRVALVKQYLCPLLSVVCFLLAIFSFLNFGR